MHKMLSPVALLLSLMAGVVGCSSWSGAASADESPTHTSAMCFQREVFADTVFLSDYALTTDSYASPAVAVLPSRLSFVDCEFQGPVYAGRPGMRVAGGSLCFAGSTLQRGADLRGLTLSHSLDFQRAVPRATLDLEGITVSHVVDLRELAASGDVRLPNARIGELRARKAVVGGALSLQRLRVTHGCSWIEAQVDGFLDASYVTVLGDSFFDLCHVGGRALMDHADFRGRLSLAQTSWTDLNIRHVRLRDAYDGPSLEELPEQRREQLRRDLDVLGQ